MRPGFVLLAWFVLAPAPFAFADNYGALAYARGTGAWGASYDQPSQQSADVSALRQCGRFSTGCDLVVHFWNTCAAYATGDGTSYGWGSHAVRRAAERTALAECSKRGGRCEIKMWACNSQPQTESTSMVPQPRPRNSCWYPNGDRVPQCRD
jgi:hypothetical protein